METASPEEQAWWTGGGISEVRCASVWRACAQTHMAGADGRCVCAYLRQAMASQWVQPAEARQYTLGDRDANPFADAASPFDLGMKLFNQGAHRGRCPAHCERPCCTTLMCRRHRWHGRQAARSRACVRGRGVEGEGAQRGVADAGHVSCGERRGQEGHPLPGTSSGGGPVQPRCTGGPRGKLCQRAEV